MSENNSVAGIFSGHGQIKTPTYKEQAYRLIKEAILYQRFQADTIYSQEAICQELGISRTPVREALLELQKENYIRFCRGKGIQIVSLDDQAIHDILEMRIYLALAGAVLAAQRAGINAARAGVTGREMDAAGRQVIAEAGYGEYFTHSFGHSLGLNIHESPNASPSETRTLPAGAVISAEPGIYIPGRFGVRSEDVLVLEEGGCEDITRSPKDLIVL